MLLRASGIPARYAVGLSVDREDLRSAPLTKEGLHTLSVNDHHAHAWVEVYVDGLGWRPCEMTPGKEGAENPFPIPPDKQKMNRARRINRLTRKTHVRKRRNSNRLRRSSHNSSRRDSPRSPSRGRRTPPFPARFSRCCSPSCSCLHFFPPIRSTA